MPPPHTPAGSARTDTTDTQTWIKVPSTDDAATIREMALASLVERGILERREEQFLWAFRSVRYPTLDDGAEREIKSRLEDVLSDEIPDPRDIALISLVDACQILPDLFPEREMEQTAPRKDILDMDATVSARIPAVFRRSTRQCPSRSADHRELALIASEDLTDFDQHRLDRYGRAVVRSS